MEERAAPGRPRTPLLRIARGPHELEAPTLPRRTAAPRPAPDEGERCDMCTMPIAPEHGHLVRAGRRELLCVCRACHLLFTQDGAARGAFGSVPDRHVALPAGGDHSWWLGLQVPVSLAFFVRENDGRIRGYYPSPASATETDVPHDAWRLAVDRHPALASLVPEVEALLVRARADAVDAFIVPIDACFELVGLLRLRWRGFGGGGEAHAALDDFFGRIAARSTLAQGAAG